MANEEWCRCRFDEKATDAEVEAAAEAVWLCDEGSIEDHPLPWNLCCDRYPGTAERYRDMARDALIAARKIQR